MNHNKIQSETKIYDTFCKNFSLKNKVDIKSENQRYNIDNLIHNTNLAFKKSGLIRIKKRYNY